MVYKLIDAPSSNKKIVELYNMMKTGDLVLHPDFQRKLVWNNRHKENFIETILRGFPFPEIYFADGELDLESMKSQTLVVDGQQRLSTINQYINGDELLECKSIPKFDDLSKEEQENFLRHPVVVRDLKSISQEEIREIFRRINSVSYALNAIEINNALYEGAFIDVAKQISEKGILNELDFMSKNEFDRMKDIEFILLIMSTIELGAYFSNNKEIESFIKQYDDEYENAENMKTSILCVMEYAKRLQLPSDSIWLSKSGMYTLLSELLFLKCKKGIDYPEIGEMRRTLMTIDEKVKHNEGSGMYYDFYQYMYQSTGSKKGRMIRGELLRKELIDLVKPIGEINA